MPVGEKPALLARERRNGDGEMAKAKIEIDTNVRGQFTSAGRIVRELSKYSPSQRKRILEIVAEANYDLPKAEPEQAELPAADAVPDALG